MIFLTMEQIFIVTGIGILVAGTVLGLLIYWLFERDNKEEDE